MTKLLIAASGTGGHIYPALSVVEALPDSWDVCWLGVDDRLEQAVLPKEYELITIPVQALQARGIRGFLQRIKLCFSIVFVVRLLLRKKIEVVLTTGGYIAAPTIIASKLCRVPIILHESNAFPGKVTRLLGRFCDQVALGLPIAKEHLKNCNLIFTGTPVRSEFLHPNPLPSWTPTDISPLIVVLGGSQGAIGLNKMVRNILPSLLKKGYRVVHIIGTNDNLSGINNPNLVEKTFTEEVAGLLHHADLVISRSGAGALSELAVCKTPAILIPYPYAADNHQDVNAAYVAQFGGALILHENVSAAQPLLKAIVRLLDTYGTVNGQRNNLLKEMSKGMGSIAVRDAHLCLVDIIRKYI
tara:strand:+ start:610 stop:1680 length:1071 start_codon:yes stop_codon:yes gene_type:complete